MDLPEKKHLLQFDPIIRIIEDGFAQLPPHITCPINIQEYVMYMLEWLCVKIEDADSETAADLGIAYLKRHGVAEDFAMKMSHHVLNEIMTLITATFPSITYHDLSLARYVWDSYFTLMVQLPVRALCTEDS